MSGWLSVCTKEDERENTAFGDRLCAFAFNELDFHVNPRQANNASFPLPFLPIVVHLRPFFFSVVFLFSLFVSLSLSFPFCIHQRYIVPTNQSVGFFKRNGNTVLAV